MFFFVFRRKDLCEASMKRKVCSNFQMSFLHLSQTDPPQLQHLVTKSGTMLGPVHLSSDVPHL